MKTIKSFSLCLNIANITYNYLGEKDEKNHITINTINSL